jgi:hypothetical protein
MGSSRMFCLKLEKLNLRKKKKEINDSFELVKEDLMIKRKIINKNDLEEDGTTDEIY